ncbi:MAG: hypothetical protein K9M11_01935, partial [Candidatus Pacebacteria bacterium]|nr:hypothetical protein [Candidatus Paceibacterota bacterium]
MLTLYRISKLCFYTIKNRLKKVKIVLKTSELNIFGKMVCIYLALTGQAWNNAEKALYDLRNRAIASVLIFCIALNPIGSILYADTTISNGMNAIDLIGQYDDSLSNPQPVYTKSGANNGPNSLGLSLTGTSDIAQDTTNHWLFISDSGNNRVLVYNLTAGNLLVDHIPDYVIGQSDFHSNTSAITQNGLVAALVGVEYDNVNKRLFVANGNRVTIYDLSGGITNGMNASYVLGQASFTTNTSSGSQSGLATVSKMRYDQDNNLLYVSQGGIDRVSIFNVNPLTIANGSNAVDAIGQYDDNLSDPQPVYTKTLANDGPNRLGISIAASFQGSVTTDSVAHLLFVADSTNNRVLVFNLDSSNYLVDRIPDYVIGQSNFYTNTALNSQSGLSAPRDVLYDGVNKYLFVSESTGNRVKVFDLSSGITNGMNASYVLGQTLYTTATAANTQSGFSLPSGLTYDSSRKYLFVSESSGNRVKVFDLSSGITNGMNASYVLGQTLYTTATAAVTQSGLSSPRGIAYDSTNKYLFVGQITGQRVSVFDTTTITNGMNAINVIGQSLFTTATAATTQVGMSGPYGVAYDNTNKRLYVAQQGSRRVTMYDLSSGITDGMGATNVLGQPSFTAAAALTTQASTRDANGVHFDSSNGRLYVSESSNGRINIFDASGTITDNMNAINLIGAYDDSLSNPQPAWTKGTINNSPNRLGMSNPTEVSLDRVHHRLFVADSLNYRVLVYNLTVGNLLIDHIPDYVLGQPDFHTAVSTTNTAAGFTTVNDISYDDVNDRLFVTEGNRVKVFNLSGGITNGMDASYVLGQAGFTTNAAGVTQSALNSPAGSYIDTANQLLYVAETGNNRVSIFNVDPSTISNGANAVNGIGQYDDSLSNPQPVYTNLTINNGPNKLGISLTTDNSGSTAFDSVNHRLFLSDTGNNRILIYNLDSSNNPVDHIPDYVLGQPNYYTNTAVNSQSGLNVPSALAYDEANSLLFVGENPGNRVKIFDLSSGITDGMNASYVLGQAGFTTFAAASTQSGLNAVRGLAYDSARKYLFVSEATGNRVKVFDLSSGITNNMNASYVIGQTLYTTATAATTQSGLNGPRGIAYDPTNKYLFVAQLAGNRVSVFNTTTITNGMNAINVIGQSSFTTATAATTQVGMSAPYAAAYDDANKMLYVSQNTSKRVTAYDFSSGIADGMNASYVLGQSNFTSALTSVTQAGATLYKDVSFDSYSGRLYVADTGANRIMVWQVSDISHPGVTVTPTSGLTTTEAGSSTTFTIVLNSQPSSDVTIGLSSSNAAEGTASPASLTFTNSNWSTPQTVTVTGVDDASVDGDVAYTIITGATASSDSSYNGLTVSDVSLTN